MRFENKFATWATTIKPEKLELRVKIRSVKRHNIFSKKNVISKNSKVRLAVFSADNFAWDYSSQLARKREFFETERRKWQHCKLIKSKMHNWR